MRTINLFVSLRKQASVINKVTFKFAVMKEQIKRSKLLFLTWYEQKNLIVAFIWLDLLYDCVLAILCGKSFGVSWESSWNIHTTLLYELRVYWQPESSQVAQAHLMDIFLESSQADVSQI